MSFATEKARSASERWAFVRFTPGREITTTLSADGGGVYSLSFDQAVSHLERNGSTLTEVTTNPPSVNDTYYVDEEAQTVKVKLASAPDADTNILVLFYHLFFTSGDGVAFHEDPSDDSTPVRMWQPRVDEEISVSQSVKNTLAGVFSIEASEISLKDPDDYVRTFFSSDDSFYNKAVVVWLAIATEELKQYRLPAANVAVERVFTGIVASASVTPNVVRFRVLDAFSRLDSSAFMGDTLEEAVFQKRATSFPDMDPRKDNRPVPFVLGTHSRWKTKPGGTLYNQEDLDPEWLYEAICTDYTNDIQDYNNREWGICRTLAGLRPIVVGTRHASTTSSGNMTTLVFTDAVWATMELIIGDTLKIGTNYGRVIRITHNVVGAKYEVYVRTDATVTPGHTSATAITVHDALELVIKIDDGTLFYPLYGKHYTATESSTSGGNKYTKITFDNNFEADDLTGYSVATDGTLEERTMPVLDPGRCQVFFRVRPDLTGAGHGAVLKEICEGAGLDTNAASFTAADAALDADCLFTIPQFDESEIGTYREYAQLILESVLGYLYVNTDGEAAYKLLAAPAPSTTRDGDQVLEEAIRVKVEYQDIVTQIIAYNPHDYADENGSGSSSETTESARARYLHGLRKVTRLRHVLSDISDRIETHLAVKSRPTVTYKWETATEDLDTDLSGDHELESSQVLGGSGAVDLKVVSVDKSANKVAVEAAVIEGI